MANEIKDYIEDVAFRVRDSLMKQSQATPPGLILRAMNRIYMNLNRECLCIQKQWDIDFADPGDDDSPDDGYFILPSDFIRPYRVRPYREFRFWDNFDINEPYKFSIFNNRIYFSLTETDSTFEVSYYSSGSTLVDKDDDDLETGELNYPEYPDHLKGILVCATALEIAGDYPLIQKDIENYRKMHTDLLKITNDPEDVSQNITGPDPLYQTLNDY